MACRFPPTPAGQNVYTVPPSLVSIPPAVQNGSFVWYRNATAVSMLAVLGESLWPERPAGSASRCPAGRHRDCHSPTLTLQNCELCERSCGPAALQTIDGDSTTVSKTKVVDSPWWSAVFRTDTQPSLSIYSGAAALH